MYLASHNTMTYLPVKQWWLKPFAWLAKCQNKDILCQYNKGARLFDFRLKPIIKKDNDGVPQLIAWAFGHGYITYKGNVFRLLNHLISISKPNFDIEIRILLEDTTISKKYSNLVKDEFAKLCKDLKLLNPRICFIGGERKSDWTKLYEFRNNYPNIIECYSSMPNNPKWYGIFPYLYRKLHKKKIRKLYTTNSSLNSYLMIDFI